MCPVSSTVTCRVLVLLNRSGSWRERDIIISFRGDLDSTGSCSQIVRCNKVHLNYVKCIIVYTYITLALYRLDLTITDEHYCSRFSIVLPHYE